MVEHLRLRWRDDLSMEALLGLREELDDMLGRIRSTRQDRKSALQVSRLWGTSDVAPSPTPRVPACRSTVNESGPGSA